MNIVGPSIRFPFLRAHFQIIEFDGVPAATVLLPSPSQTASALIKNDNNNGEKETEQKQWQTHNNRNGMEWNGMVWASEQRKGFAQSKWTSWEKMNSSRTFVIGGYDGVYDDGRCHRWHIVRCALPYRVPLRHRGRTGVARVGKPYRIVLLYGTVSCKFRQQAYLDLRDFPVFLCKAHKRLTQAHQNLTK